MNVLSSRSGSAKDMYDLYFSSLSIFMSIFFNFNFI